MARIRPQSVPFTMAFSSVDCTLCVRVPEHAGRSHRTNHLLTNPPYSSILDHASACDSPVSLDNFSILVSYIYIYIFFIYEF